MFFLMTILVLLLFIIIYIDWRKKKEFEQKYGQTIPVLPFFPIFGSVHRLFMRDPLEVALGIAKELKSSYYFWGLSRPYYFTIDPEEIKIFLNHRSTSERGYLYQFLKHVMPGSLIHLPDEEWKKQRKLLSKIFRHKVLDSLIPRFNESTDDYCEIIEEVESNHSLENKNSRFFLDNFFENLCKGDLQKKLKCKDIYENYDINQAAKILGDTLLIRLFNPLYHFDFIFDRTPKGRNFNEFLQKLQNFIVNLILTKRARRKEPDYAKEIDGSTLIDVMDEEGIVIENIAGEVKFFFGAASETTGKVLTMALSTIGLYPDIQEKLYEEVKDLTGENGFIDSKILTDLKYTEKIILETLRMFTPVPFIVREVTEDLEMKGNIIPKGTNILLCLFGTHRNEEYWEDPSRFDPERFSPEKIDRRHPFSFIPFSGGPKNCIGFKYGLMTLKIVLAKILRKYKVKTNLKSIEDIRLRTLATLTLDSEFHVTFIPRVDK